jgi:hypothetical protein
MKRIIEKYDHEFIKDGNRICCTYIEIQLSELPEDCDFTGLEVIPINVMYDDCRIKITGFDINQNGFMIKIPNSIKFFLYKAREQGQKCCIELLEKYNYETDCVKNKKEIGYNNTVYLK